MNGVQTDGWTKMALPPLPFLDADTRYANVLMSDDPEHEVAIARLGGFDADKQRHVGAQPYQVGVFFDGSIDEAWKPHHDKDLTFKIFAARFTSIFREVDAGTLQLTNCSDLIVSCGFEEPAAECSITVRITRANGEVIRSRPGQPVRFDEHLTEAIGIVIEMRGTQLASPTLYPFVQVVQGNLQQSGSYISRAMPADPGGDVNVVVTFDCLLPGGSDVSVSVGQPDSWQNAVLHGATPLGDGWQERTYKLEDVRATDVRAKLEISGLAGARPLVRSLRANVTSDPVNIISGS
jgi:hypothetical protein